HPPEGRRGCGAARSCGGLADAAALRCPCAKGGAAMRLCTLLFLIITSSARAEDLEWSFRDYPPLAEEELSISFEDAIQVAERTGEESCTVFAASALQDYL